MRLERELLVEADSDDFMETAACVGVICGRSFVNELTTFIDKGVGDREKLLERVKGFTHSGAYDWNKNGVSLIGKLEADSDKTLRCFSLVAGMGIFIDKVWSKIDSGKPKFIHGSIAKFYKAEVIGFGRIKGSKANTSDIIITSTDHKTLIDDVKSGGTPDSSYTHTITQNNHKYTQVSHKLGEELAQLGKVGTKIKQITGMSHFATSNAVDKFSQNIDNSVNLYEGVWGGLKSIGISLLNKLNSILGRFTSSITKRFGKINKSHLSQFDKMLMEGTGDAAMVAKVINNPDGALRIVNVEYYKCKQLAYGADTVILGDVMTYTSGSIDKSSAFKLIANYLTFVAVQGMMRESKKLSTNVNKVMAEMSFGATKMPMWKVYGYTGSSVTYKYMGTVDRFIDDKPELETSIMGLFVRPKKSFYTITLYMLESVGEKGKVYARMRTGTNDKTKATFVLEGVKRIGPYPLDEDLESIIHQDQRSDPA